MGQDSNKLDSILDEFGQFGCYQLINFALICIPVVFSSIFGLSYIFTAGVVQHRCLIPECDTANSVYLEIWLNNTIPFENGIPLKCMRFAQNNESGILQNSKCSRDQCNISNISYCTDPIYKGEEETIQNTWDIICDEEWKLNLVGSISSVGSFVGMPLGGFISDEYGRRFVLLMGVFLSSLIATIKSFSSNYLMFIIFEFMSVSFSCVIYPACIILGLELVGPKHRVLGAMTFSLFYPVGEMILALAAKYTQNWRLLLQVLCSPAILLLSYFWLIPESVRWQLVNGKFDSAVTTLRKVASFNGNVITEDSFVRLRNCAEKISKGKLEIVSETHFPIWVALKTPVIFWRFANSSFCWMTNAFVFYGLSLNSVSLIGDKYVNFILISAVEIPALFINYNLLDRIGRRLTLCISLLTCSASCVASIFIEDDEQHQWWKLATFLTGKLAITMSFSTTYIYTSELFPTNLRHSFLSLNSMIGRIGAIAAPQTPLIGQYVKSLPMILFSGFALTSGLLVLKLPETINTNLPNNISEAEMVGKIIKKTTL